MHPGGVAAYVDGVMSKSTVDIGAGFWRGGIRGRGFVMALALGVGLALLTGAARPPVGKGGGGGKKHGGADDPDRTEEVEPDPDAKPPTTEPSEDATSQPTSKPTSRPGEALENSLTDLDGKPVKLEEYKGQVILLVPVAWDSNRRQFEDLQRINNWGKDQGMMILLVLTDDFAPETRSDKDVAAAIKDRYQTDMIVLARTHVKGEKIHPLFKFLTSPATGHAQSGDIEAPFTKFLLDRNGDICYRWGPKERLTQNKNARILYDALTTPMK